MPILKNAKHERFAQEVAKGKTADEAYRLAGYAENRGNAIRLKANESILRRVGELQAKAAERTTVTIESLTTELEEARVLAFKEGQASAAVTATMGKAKLHGLGSETHRMTGANGGPVLVEKVSARELLLDRIAGVSARARTGGDPSKPH